MAEVKDGEINEACENPGHFVARLFEKLGEEEGIDVHLEPEWKHVGRITRPDGTVTHFRGTNLDLNGIGSMEIARDKGYASYFLKRAGYNIIPSKTFYSPKFAKALENQDDPEAAYKYAEDLGFPVVVKPNSASQGKLVCVANDRQTFIQAVRKICKIDRCFLVQPLMTGRDYRVVVLDGEVLSAYERLPLTVIGDGTSTIDQLLDKKQIEFKSRGRDTTINKLDFRIGSRLKRHGMKRTTILTFGEKFELLDNRNLSTGGEAIDVTGTIDHTYEDLAVRIVRDMGLRYCGVDLMVQQDINKPLESRTNNYHVIEINSAPGIDHYAESGKKQKLIVAEMYRKVLIALAKTRNA